MTTEQKLENHVQNLESHNKLVENIHMKDFIDWCESEEIIWRLVKDQLLEMKKKITNDKRVYFNQELKSH